MSFGILNSMRPGRMEQSPEKLVSENLNLINVLLSMSAGTLTMRRILSQKHAAELGIGRHVWLGTHEPTVIHVNIAMNDNKAYFASKK